MKYFLTTFLYPLENAIPLSNEVPIILDNPRTKEEIEDVKNILSEHLNKIELIKKKKNFREISKLFKKSLIEIETDNSYVLQYLNKYDEKNFFEFISKMWVILKYPEDKESKDFEKYNKEIAQNFNIKVPVPQHKFYENREATLNYCMLFSFLSQQRESYINYDNIIFEHELMPSIEVGSRALAYLMDFWVNRWLVKERKEFNNWKFFPTAIKIISEYTKKIDSLSNNIKNGKKITERLLYFGNILLLSSNIYTKDYKIKILLLTSLLESLLTHNPDFRRFNVEDSISKQFKLKGVIIIYLNNVKMKIPEIAKKLKEIYEIRSNIVHGNFNKIEKTVSKLQQEGETLNDYYKDIVKNLYIFIRAIMKEYINNPEFIDFIKDN